MEHAKAEGEDAEGPAGAVLGHVVPKRRFTRWAAWYAVLYLCLPLLALGALIDALLYVAAPILGHCFALFCLFG